MKKNLIFLFLFYGFVSNLHAQAVEKISIPLHDTSFDSNSKLPMVIDFVINCKDNYDTFEGLPGKLKNYKIKEYQLKKFFTELNKENRKIYFLVIGNKSNYKIKVDKNFNNNFSDDSILTTDEIQNGFSFSFALGNKIYTKKIKLFPFYDKKKWGNQDEQQWQMALTSWPNYKYAELKVGLVMKDIYFLNISMYNKWNKNSTVYYADDYDEKENPDERFTFQDSFSFFHHNFILDSINPPGTTAYFYEVPHKGKCGYNIGDSVCITDTFVLNRNESYNLNFPKQKLTLLHFWGTWCGPCVAELPMLNLFIGKYKSKLECINIACEENVNIKELNNFYEKYPFLSNNITIQQPSPFAENNTMVRKLKVSVFPTYMIIDKNGVIIYRTVNENDLKNIETLVQNY
jgi:thiol-disulfide isomerase/thioredoxin